MLFTIGCWRLFDQFSYTLLPLVYSAISLLFIPIFLSLIAGATREIGVCLNRVVIRHRAMESRMKTLCSALLDCLVTPLQDRLDEWRRTAVALDKGEISVARWQNLIPYFPWISMGPIHEKIGIKLCSVVEP